MLSLGPGDERAESLQTHPILEEPSLLMSTPAPQDPRPGRPPRRVPRNLQEPLQECGYLPGPGPTLRLPPTPQAALFQRHRTPEGSGPIPLARTGRHPGNRGHRGCRGLLHGDAGPDAAGGHCQPRSAVLRSRSPQPCPRTRWALGARSEGRPFLSPAGMSTAPRTWGGRASRPVPCWPQGPHCQGSGPMKSRAPVNEGVSGGHGGPQRAPGPGAGHPHNLRGPASPLTFPSSSHQLPASGHPSLTDPSSPLGL